MDRITSRQNRVIRSLRALARERRERRERGEFLCDGAKLLTEAVQNGAAVRTILLREGASVPELPEGAAVYLASEDVFAYVSPLENSPGPLFTVAIPKPPETMPKCVLVLENLQDPGNVGTVLRSSAALGCELVVLTGASADPYNPKTVRAAMGALFRQPLLELTLEELSAKLREWQLPLYGAALADDALDVRTVSLKNAALAVGNEGHGLSQELLSLCDKKIIIPMTPGSESLNAAVAASVLLWEAFR